MGARIELTPEQLEVLVPEVLMETYDMVSPDWGDEKQLLLALEVVLEYFMSPTKYEAWKNGILSQRPW